MMSRMRQWLLLVATLLMLGGAIVYGLFNSHQEIEKLERQRLSTQAKVVDANLEHQLGGVNKVLEGIQNDIAYWIGRSHTDTDSSSRHLLTLRAAMPGVRTLLVLNGKGVVMASDRPSLVGQDFSDRPYFKLAREQANPRVVHVLPPFTTALGAYAIVLGRSVTDAAGNFAGMVTATLDPAYFSILLGSVRYADDMRVSIVHAEGTLFLSVPVNVKIMQSNLSRPGSFFQRHVDSGQDTSLFSGRVAVNGEYRMMALRTIQPQGVPVDRPLVAAVSRELSAIYADWRRDTIIYGSLFALFSFAVVSALYMRQRRQLAHQRYLAVQNGERLQRELALRDSERFLAALIDAMPGMAGYWNQDLRCTFANREYLMWFGRTPKEIRGIHIRDLLGEELFLKNQPEIQGALQGKAQHFERILVRPDGLSGYTWVHYLPDIDGDKVRGFFVLVTDISELKKTQLQLEELNEALKQRTSQAEAAITDYQRAETELRIVATAFESQQAIMITDAAGTILRVNGAFSASTGYSSADIVGKTPHVLKSDRHDRQFYRDMRDSLVQTGVWQGEIWDSRKNGEVYPNWTTITAVKDAAGEVTHFVTTQIDITLRKSAEEEIRHLAFYDSLTGLPNRRLLMQRMRQAQAEAVKNGRGGALMFIDLDNFKNLNDTLGHDKGDQLLVQVAQRLPYCVRDSDTVARLGGDEFVVMLEDLSMAPQEAASHAEAVCDKILHALNQPYQLDGQTYHSTASIGIALFGSTQNSVEELMKQADVAMYQAKSGGRNTQRFFDPEMQAIVTANAAIEIELRLALQQNEFVLYYQAQVNETSAITGVEVLLRWQHPLRGLVPPGHFIPIAEQSSLIVPIGQWVLEQACHQLAAWAGMPGRGHLTMAVNISARQFYRPDFVPQVLAALTASGANPHRLKLELTESLLLEDMEDIIAKMSQLKAYGVGFSLDDFGIGYSSLSYLKRLPLDQLKIDQSFVRDVMTDLNDAVIVRTILALGQSLGLEVIAEGVENESQRSFLAAHACHAFQGYLFSRPVPLEQFEELMRQADLAGSDATLLQGM